jgi:hypothetical protein
MNAPSAPLTPGTIIAGRFDTFDQAEDARDRLEVAGFPRSSIAVFFNNPPGRHDLTEIGGDEHADPQAENAAGGALAGAAAGAAGLGLAAAATGPFGVAALAGVGAYVGALAGAVSSTDPAREEQPLRRPAGVMVAVQTGPAGREEDAIRALQDLGADNIERAEGTLRDGDWTDFDPLATPQLIAPAPGTTGPRVRTPEARP